MIGDSTVIILTALLFAISCGWLGSFLVLRKMAMVGDAISHAVLPGLFISFLISGSRQGPSVLLGAAALGVICTFLIEFFHKRAKLQNDAAIGVTFTSLFALGVLLISLFGQNVDLDQECILYGEIAYVPFEPQWQVFGLGLPRSLWTALLLLAVNALVLALSYRRWKVTTFDPVFAATTGISVAFWHYLLMALVSVTSVAAFQSVGAILIVALLVVPAATAYLLTQTLAQMLGLSTMVAVFISLVGYALAYSSGGSIAGSMVMVAGALFFIVLIAKALVKTMRQTSKKVERRSTKVAVAHRKKEED